MSAAGTSFSARWAVALRLGRRDAAAHRLRSAMVVVLVAVATGVGALPAVALARAVTPGSVLGISGTRYDGLEDRLVRIDPATFTTLGVVGAVAALQAIVLIAPAFLLGVRRRVRELGVIAAAGASPSDLRRAVLAPGLICGVVGAAVGASVAYVLVLLAIPVGSPGELLTGALAAVAAGLAGTAVAVTAAWYPAVVAMRESEPGALSGVPSLRTVPWILPAALAAVAAGVLLAVHGTASRPVAVIGGVLAAEAGLIAALGVALGALERVPARGAVTTYVLRDAARHRLRVLPAVAAGVAMVALASAAMVYQHTQHAAEAARSSFPSAARGSVWVLTDDSPERLADRAGTSALTPVRAAVGPDGPAVVVVDGHLLGGSALTSEGPLVGDRDLAAALGLSPQAGDDLDAGRVLVAEGGQVSADGTVVLDVLGGRTGVVVPAAVAEGVGDYAGVILSQDAADELGLTVRGVGVIASDDGPLDPWQVAALAEGASVVELGTDPPDLHDPATQYGLVAAGILAVLLVTWVTTALAAQEARADLETLEAVGAPPRTRRRITAGQAGLVATLGAWCGVPAGIALGALLVDVQASQAIMGGRPGPDLSVPWWPVVALLVVLPVVVALLSALTTPTGVRLTQHADR